MVDKEHARGEAALRGLLVSQLRTQGPHGFHGVEVVGLLVALAVGHEVIFDVRRAEAQDGEEGAQRLFCDGEKGDVGVGVGDERSSGTEPVGVFAGSAFFRPTNGSGEIQKSSKSYSSSYLGRFFQFPIVHSFGLTGASRHQSVLSTLSIRTSVVSGELSHFRELSLVELVRVIARDCGGVIDLGVAYEAGEPETLVTPGFCKVYTHRSALE